MTRLGFEVRIYRNQPKQNVGDLLEKLGKLDMTHIDVFGMAISSHGSSNNIIYLSDAPTDLNFFVDPIKE